MATINDKDSGATVKISSEGSMLVTTGDDGYPTFFTKIWHPRLTSSIGANACVWAIRAPLSRTIIIRGGEIVLSVDTTATTLTEAAIDIVRFSGIDPTGGSLLIPARMKTSDATPQTTMIRAASATIGLTITSGVDPATTGFAHLAVPAVAGASTGMSLSEWTGLEIGEGEGLAIYTRGGGAPIGFQTSGWLQFSEKV